MWLLSSLNQYKPKPQFSLVHDHQPLIITLNLKLEYIPESNWKFLNRANNIDCNNLRTIRFQFFSEILLELHPESFAGNKRESSEILSTGL